MAERTRLFITHGYGASPTSHWFPWLGEKLSARGVAVTSVTLPDPQNPQLPAWLSALQAAAPDPNERTFFVGHSLGTVTLLRYLEALPRGARVGGAVFVAGFCSKVLALPELDPFVERPFDFVHLKTVAPMRAIIGSRDDAIVPFSQTEELARMIDAPLHTMNAAGHFCACDGCFELPEIFDIILTQIHRSV